mmetsp:Transcript_8764/g.10481  ORF Transcript_8764/g.10481 Transcript_8764/m.10481 type:complete len:245 (-) Transcript_8764:340-1074(-)
MKLEGNSTTTPTNPGYLKGLYSSGKQVYSRSRRTVKENYFLSRTVSPSIDILERISERLFLDYFLEGFAERVDTKICAGYYYSSTAKHAVVSRFESLRDRALHMIGLEVANKFHHNLVTLQRRNKDLESRIKSLEESNNGKTGEIESLTEELVESRRLQETVQEQVRELNNIIVALEIRKSRVESVSRLYFTFIHCPIIYKKQECSELKDHLKESLSVHEQDEELIELFAAARDAWEVCSEFKY